MCSINRSNVTVVKEQIKRCREIFLLASVDESNVEELRKYRLLVKRSLFKKNQEILGAIEDEKER